MPQDIQHLEKCFDLGNPQGINEVESANELWHDLSKEEIFNQSPLSNL